MRAGLTTQKLIAAAGEMADAEGFQQVTLSALARRFGVQTASLYAHLRNSDHLKRGIALLALTKLADAASDAVAGRSGRAALVALADVHRNFAQQHPGLFEAARYRLGPDEAAASAGIRLAGMTRAVLRGYDVPAAEEVHAVRFLGSIFLGFSTLERSGSFDHSEPGPDASWQRALDALDHLLRHWPGSGR